MMAGKQDKTVLLRVLGESPELKVIDSLVDNPVLDLTAEDISEVTGLETGKVEDVLEKLESWGIVEIKGVRKGERTYTFRESSDAVRHLVRFETSLADRED